MVRGWHCAGARGGWAAPPQLVLQAAAAAAGSVRLLKDFCGTILSPQAPQLRGPLSHVWALAAAMLPAACAVQDVRRVPSECCSDGGVAHGVVLGQDAAALQALRPGAGRVDQARHGACAAFSQRVRVKVRISMSLIAPLRARARTSDVVCRDD